MIILKCYINMTYYFYNATNPRYRGVLWRQGKSGQHRAAYRLTAGSFFKGRESATENNFRKSGNGENVR